MRVGDAESIALAGGEPARQLMLGLLAEISELRGRVEELERQSNRNSTNSSLPPSRDAPMTRQQRRALARERAKQSLRKQGGQPGHEGKTREMVAPDRLDERRVRLPARCGCGHQFAGDEPAVGDPVCHQQYELPVIVPLVIEHRRARLACPGCGRAVLADLPGPALAGFGPRLDAHIAVLAGVFRLSRDQVRQVVVEVFGVPASKGSIDNALMRMSAILADPWSELRDAVRQADAVHADETSWRLQGATNWLWVAASALMACYRIDPRRTRQAAQELLGEDFGSIAITDRYAAYHWLDVLQQQLCWAHLIRQLTDLSERPGAPGKLGKKLLAAARQVIRTHRAYLTDGRDLDWLAAELEPLRDQIQALLEHGTRARHAKTARFAAGLLEEYEALWTFCEVPGINPTNNAAERALRHGVIMRKTQLGTQSEKGNRWIERICSVRETCMLQSRSAVAYLTEAATAAHHGQPIPTLVPT